MYFMCLWVEIFPDIQRFTNKNYYKITTHKPASQSLPISMCTNMRSYDKWQVWDSGYCDRWVRHAEWPRHPVCTDQVLQRIDLTVMDRLRLCQDPLSRWNKDHSLRMQQLLVMKPDWCMEHSFTGLQMDHVVAFCLFIAWEKLKGDGDYLVMERWGQ